MVAANHPSYLDPVLLSLQVRRPIRFMAWDALFRVPLLGALIRTFGAFPVDTRPGKGREAYERAKALVLSGEVVGLFPEGHRSRTGWMEPRLREGAARLAWETGALLVPATIAGAYRAWPHYQALPRPGAHPRPLSRAHRPRALSRPAGGGRPARAPGRAAAAGGSIAAAGGEGRPARDAALRLARAAAPRRTSVAAAGAGRARPAGGRRRARCPSCPPPPISPTSCSTGARFPQSRLAKWIRNASPVVFLLATGPRPAARAGQPARRRAGAALVAVLAGRAASRTCTTHGRTAMTFLRGMVLAFALEAAAQRLWPSAAGPHAALALYAAVFAIGARSRLLALRRRRAARLRGRGAAAASGWSVGLALHLLAGLLAAALALAFPYRLRAAEPFRPPASLAPAGPIE